MKKPFPSGKGFFIIGPCVGAEVRAVRRPGPGSAGEQGGEGVDGEAEVARDLVAVAAFSLAWSFLSSLVPARMAARVDVTEALRAG